MASKIVRIGLHDADGGKHPNLALGKLAAKHRALGHEVERFMALMPYDMIYASMVFSWSDEDPSLPSSAIRGGTGYGCAATLPEDVEHLCPDYDFLGINHSLGFTTRGCPNRCPFCIVPKKEGPIRAHADVEEFLRHKSVVLMDNNILAHPHGIAQLEKLARLEVRVDINQGVDASLIDGAIARRLAGLKYIRFLRLACDSRSEMASVDKALQALRAAGLKAEIFCYVLIEDVESALERIEFLRSRDVTMFGQPLRPLGSRGPAPLELRRLARYVNHKAIFKSVPWEQYNSSIRNNRTGKSHGKEHDSRRGRLSPALAE